MNELLRKLMGRVLMAPEGGDGGSSGGGGGGSAGGDGGSAAGDEGSLLDDAGTGGEGGDAGDNGGTEDDATLTPEQRAAKAAEKDTRRPKHIPGKFWDAEKGEIKHEAMAKSYSELEGRIKDVGLPPKDAGEYKFEVPQAFKEAGVDFDPDTLAKLKGFAHKAGYSQKQFEATMTALYGEAESIAKTAERLDKSQTMKALTSHFKTPEAVQANVKAAYSVFQAYADEEEMKHLYRVVNDPIAVRVLAKINKELQEDPGVSTEAILTGDSVEELMAKGSPYWDASHPQHQRVKQKVAAHFDAQAKAGARKRAA